MIETFRAAQFLIVGPIILAFLAVINWMTSPGDWWVQWAALGIGIAWVFCLIRVIGAIAVAGGVAAFIYAMRRRDRSGSDRASS